MHGMTDETAMPRDSSPYSLENALSWQWAVLLLFMGLMLLCIASETPPGSHAAAVPAGTSATSPAQPGPTNTDLAETKTAP